MILENQKCRKCKHFTTRDDPAFIVNGTHYHCKAVTYLEVNEYGYEDYVPVCIDGFNWHTRECPKFEER